MQNEKSIETKELTIKGNIMTWQDTMIQLSNVSCISTSPMSLKPFPLLSVLLIVVGCFLFKVSAISAVFVIALGAAWIYFWYQGNEKLKASSNLNVLVNAGTNLRFVFEDKEFLQRVLNVLERIIVNGGVGNQEISINIKDCKISGDANILNGAQV